MLKVVPWAAAAQSSWLICAFGTCILLCVLLVVYLFRAWGGFFGLNIIFLPCGVAENLKQQGRMVIGRTRKGTKMFLVLKAKSECVKQCSHWFLGLEPEWGVVSVITSVSHIFHLCEFGALIFAHAEQLWISITERRERNWGGTEDLVTLVLYNHLLILQILSHLILHFALHSLCYLELWFF